MTDSDTLHDILDALEEQAPMKKGEALTALATDGAWGPNISRQEAAEALGTLSLHGHIDLADDILTINSRDEGDADALTSTTLGTEKEYASHEQFERLYEQHTTLVSEYSDLTERVADLEQRVHELEREEVADGGSVGHYGDKQDRLVREDLDRDTYISRQALKLAYLNQTTKISDPQTAEERVRKNAEYATDMEYNPDDETFHYLGQ